MALVDRDRDVEEEELDLARFNSIMDEYSSSFKNPPKSTQQLVQFCNDKEYNFKYGELNPFFVFWNKQQSNKTTGGDVSVSDKDESDKESDDESEEIDWESFWDEYQEKYQYPPKKAVHLWNFAKEDKLMTVKYKEARIAFDRIYATKSISSPSPIEGRTRSNTDLGLKSNASSYNASSLGLVEETESTELADNKTELDLKVTKYTSSEDLESIKSKFLDLLNRFRLTILHDPVSPLQLFNFINEDTEYKVRYGDVKKCYNFASKHKWFVPMKRMKKTKKRRKGKKVKTPVVSSEVSSSSSSSASDGDSDRESGEGVEYVLAVDHEKIERERRAQEEEKKEVVVMDEMSDVQFDDVLIEYNKEYKNPPRTASQIMNFAKDIGQIYKYKACRIAFNRWKNIRGAVMPEVVEKNDSEEPEEEEEVVEPGKVDRNEEDEDTEDEEEEEESD